MRETFYQLNYITFCLVSRIRTYGEQPHEVHIGFQDRPLKPTRALLDLNDNVLANLYFNFRWHPFLITFHYHFAVDKGFEPLWLLHPTCLANKPLYRLSNLPIVKVFRSDVLTYLTPKSSSK